MSLTKTHRCHWPLLGPWRSISCLGRLRLESAHLVWVHSRWLYCRYVPVTTFLTSFLFRTVTQTWTTPRIRKGSLLGSCWRVSSYTIRWSYCPHLAHNRLGDWSNHYKALRAFSRKYLLSSAEVCLFELAFCWFCWFLLMLLQLVSRWSTYYRFKRN